MIRRPPRSTLDRSSAASDVYKRQGRHGLRKAYVTGANVIELEKELGSSALVSKEGLRNVKKQNDLTVISSSIIDLSLIHISEPTRPY